MTFLASMDDAKLGMLLIIGGVVLVAVLVGWHLAEQRRKALAACAAAMGFSYDAYPLENYHERYAGFSPFGNGHSRKTTNLIYGTRGPLEWSMFDYKYVTGSGKNRTTHQVGVIAAAAAMSFPRLRMRGESFLDRIVGAVGFDDIDFESDEFSRAYYVKCDDRKRAYDLIHPQMMQYLLAVPRYDWQFAGRTILIHKSGHYRPDQFQPIMEAIEGFLARIPEFVREDLGRTV